MWCQRLAPFCVAGTSVWCLCKPRHCATPSGALTSPGVWMVALLEYAPLHVVPGTWPLTSSLLYKHYLFSSPPGALPSFPLCVFSVRTGYEPGALKKTKELLVFRLYTIFSSLDAIRVGQDRDSHDTHTSTVSNFEKFYMIYLFVTYTILNLYLSVAALGFCLGETFIF